MRPVIESGDREIREGQKEVRIGLISDTQNLENPEDIVRKLGTEKFDLIIHLGDAAVGPMTNGLVQEGKRIFGIKEGLIKGELTETEEADYQQVSSSADFKRFTEQGDHKPRAYMKAKMILDPDLKKRDTQIERERTEKLLIALNKLGIPIKHLMGNIEMADPERLSFIQEKESQLGIEGYTEPDFIDLGETALIVWPYQNIDPKRKDEINNTLEKKAEELAQKAAGKKQVIVIAHEHLLKGPLNYGERAQEACFKKVRLPRLQPQNSYSHLVHLLSELPAETKISYVHGHLHDPKETLKAGMPYLQEEDGKFKYGVGIPHTERYKEINIIYLPHGETAALEINSEGVKIKEK